MPFDPRTVGPRIRMLMPESTASEARIAEFLLRSHGDGALPLKEVAQEAETSEAMVVKTAKRLGFSGYKELRAALHAYKKSAPRRSASGSEAGRHSGDDRAQSLPDIDPGAGGDACDSLT